MNDLDLSIVRNHFELIKHSDSEGNDRWSARGLMARLGYDKWENFEKVINKAKTACEKSDFTVKNHFPEIRKMVPIGSGATRNQVDYELSRYACYLIAQNGDSSKEQIALAQTYFAFQTRKQEIIVENVQELERIEARNKLTETEKRFSGVMFERNIGGKGMSIIRARGDKALFNGNTTEDMKRKLNVPDKRPLADFLPTITIKAKDLATEMTTFKTKEKNLRGEQVIGGIHESHNKDVRGVLVKEGIYPEKLPPEEDVKKIERKIKSEQKLLHLRQKFVKD